jgi:hypothetical protein
MNSLTPCEICCRKAEAVVVDDDGKEHEMEIVKRVLKQLD